MKSEVRAKFVVFEREKMLGPEAELSFFHLIHIELSTTGHQDCTCVHRIESFQFLLKEISPLPH